MSEPTYRIRPLEWEQFGTAFRTMTVVGRYLCGAGYFYTPGDDCVDVKDLSPEAAKDAAEAHYRERLMTALEEVT